jgi:hypothetical protein
VSLRGCSARSRTIQPTPSIPEYYTKIGLLIENLNVVFGDTLRMREHGCPAEGRDERGPQVLRMERLIEQSFAKTLRSNNSVGSPSSCPLLAKTCPRVRIRCLYPPYILSICFIYLFQLWFPVHYRSPNRMSLLTRGFSGSISANRTKGLYSPFTACMGRLNIDRRS